MHSNYKERKHREEIHMWIIFLVLHHNTAWVLLTQLGIFSLVYHKVCFCCPKLVVEQPACPSLNHRSHHNIARIMSLKLCCRNLFLFKDLKTLTWPFLRFYRVNTKTGRMSPFSAGSLTISNGPRYHCEGLGHQNCFWLFCWGSALSHLPS